MLRASAYVLLFLFIDEETCWPPITFVDENQSSIMVVAVGAHKNTPMPSTASSDEDMDSDSTDDDVPLSEFSRDAALPPQKSTVSRKIGGRRNTPVGNMQLELTQSYDQVNSANAVPKFEPVRDPGVYLPDNTLLRGKMNKALDFFSLFVTDKMVNEISTHTNTYGWSKVTNVQYYGNREGAWKKTNPDEIRDLIAQLLYQGLVRVSTFYRYSSTKSLYNGLWAREFMDRDRFKALMAMLHIVDPLAENEKEKLSKISAFADSSRILITRLSRRTYTKSR